MLFLEELQGKEKEKPAPVPEEPEIPKVETKKKRKTRGRKPLPEDLPRDRVEHDVAEDQKTCTSCGTAKTMIREQISEQLEYVPASLRVTQHVQLVYACPSAISMSVKALPAKYPEIPCQQVSHVKRIRRMTLY